MAWQKTGYQDSVEYDPDRHVVRYGAYEFHGKDVGLGRDTFEIDPNQVKSIDDVYLALGADAERIKSVNTANTLYSAGTAISGGQPAVPFAGKEAWKNAAAKTIYETLNPKQSAPPVWNTSASIGVYAPPTPDTRTLSTQKLDTGAMQFTFSDKVPTDYDFVDRVSSMANALAAGGGEQATQRTQRRTASGAF